MLTFVSHSDTFSHHGRMKTAGWILLVALIVAGGLAFFALDFPRQPSNDMAPSLRKGDLVLACRVCGAPQRGDVVFFSVPEKPAELSLRRVVAIPGDKVEIQKGRVLVNGEPLPEEKIAPMTLDLDPVATGPHPYDAAIETLGTHHFRTLRDRNVSPAPDRPAETLADAYFLLADRRTLTSDSREYGPVKRRAIRSRALRILSAGDGDAARQAKIP